jgi:putative membrane protein insertion efficiency factor
MRDVIDGKNRFFIGKHDRPMSRWYIINQVPIALIKFYRAFVSPLLGPSCKYHPTCSAYALEAFQEHNILYASMLTVWRVLRCNPFSRGGYDPVPQGKKNLYCKTNKESCNG